MRPARVALTVTAVLATWLISLLVWAPTATASDPCIQSATPPTTPPRGAVLWAPPDGSTEGNAVVLNFGESTVSPSECFDAMQSPHLISVAPGAALAIFGTNLSTGQNDLVSPWGAVTVSQSTPIDYTPDTSGDWEDWGGVSSMTVMDPVAMVQTYGSCRSCDFASRQVAFSGFVQPISGPVVGYLYNVNNANFTGATLTGNAESLDFSGGTFTGATINASFSGATFNGATVDRANFAGSTLKSATLNSLKFTDPPSFANTRMGGGLGNYCTSLATTNLLDVSFAGMTWANELCSTPVFDGSTVPVAALAGIYVTSKVKNVDLGRVRLVASGRDRGTFAGADLSGVNFAGLQFLGAPLDLTGTNLTGATLTGAGFVEARLTGATLNNVSAAGVSFQGADLRGNGTLAATTFAGSQTNLEQADFDDANISGASFVGADISSATFTGARGFNTDFNGVNANSAVFSEAHLYGTGEAFHAATDLSGADFTGAVLAGSAAGGGFDFTGALLRGAHFDQSICVGCTFAQATLDNATFTSAYLPGVILTGATLPKSTFARSWLYCGAGNAACPPAQGSSTLWQWPLNLGSGESYGPVTFGNSDAATVSFADVTSCPDSTSGINGCSGHLLPNPQQALPIPAPCSSSGTGSCPTTTQGLFPVKAGPLSMAPSAPVTWSSTLSPQGTFTGFDDSVVRLMTPSTGAVVAGKAGSACGNPTAACGDGGPATTAQLGRPSGLAVGLDGTLYIADSTLRRVRAVSPSGMITTVAGTGATCATAPCGDGRAATAAALTAANGVAVDTHGGLYIADGSAGIRRVAPNGTISTLAAGSATGTTVAVALGPDGTVYASSRGPDAVLAVDPGTGAVTTAVGTGTSGYNGTEGPFGPNPGNQTQVNQPTGLAFNLDGILVYADSGNDLVRGYNPVTGNVTDEIAGVVDSNGNPQGGFNGNGKPADQTLLQNPLAVATTSSAIVLTADTGNQQVRQVGPNPPTALGGAPGPTSQIVLSCRPGITWTCQRLPKPTDDPHTTTTGSVAVTRDGLTLASGPFLLAGGGLSYLVTETEPLRPGTYTLAITQGKHVRSVTATIRQG